MVKDTGFETLKAISQADAFNKWMFEIISPYCHGNILEIGSGIGNISRLFVENKFTITLSDNDNFYVQKLKLDFPAVNVLCIDLAHKDFFNQYKTVVQQFDTVFLLNVLEHIQDDSGAINNCKQLLKTGGTLIILTPSYPFLYGNLDKHLHHFRRYTTRSLKSVILKNGFIVNKMFHFNLLGVFGWLYAKIFGLQQVPEGEMKIFNRLTGFARLLDKITFQNAGLSIIAVAKKNN